jgi:GNAT superfamily N-acetyltransferase
MTPLTNTQIAPVQKDAALHVRPLHRDDGHLLDRIMAGMSRQSRYQRFHWQKPHLTESDRRFLTDVDGHDHIALVAFDGGGDPLAVGRAIRHKTDASGAEIAVAVVDASQHKGIGMDLVARLARKAAAAGIERFVAHVLAETGLAGALGRRGWYVTGRDGPVYTLEAPVWRLAAG